MRNKLKSNIKNCLLREIQDLSDPEVSKILKVIHFFKVEILEKKEQADEDLHLFWQSFGSWKDERSPEEIIQDIYESRKSTSRAIHL